MKPVAFTPDQAAEYMANQRMLWSEYQALKREYMVPTWDVRHHNRLLEDRMTDVEHEMLASPSLTKYINPDGDETELMIPRRVDAALFSRRDQSPEDYQPPKFRWSRSGGVDVPLGIKTYVDMPEADTIRPIPRSEWGDYIEDPDRNLRPHIREILDQDGVGSCASEGITGSIQVTGNVAGRPFELLQPWFIYHTVSGGRDGGSAPSDNVSFAVRYGVCRQSVQPRSYGWRRKPTDLAYEDAKKSKLLEYVRVRDDEEWATCCFLGAPVYGGYSGHAWFGYGIASRTKILWCNSWGSDWADGGCSTLNFSSIMWAYGAWGIMAVVRPTEW